MSSPLKTMERLIASNGGKFVRLTGKGHRRWRIGASFIDLPMHGLDEGRLRANVVQQIKRAIRGNGKTPAAVEEELHHATASPREVVETSVVRAEAGAAADAGAGDARVDDARDGRPDDRRVVPSAPDDAPLAPVTQHATAHSEPLFPCVDCGRSFKLPQGLGRHRSAFHAGRVTAKPAKVAAATSAKVTATPPAPPAKPAVTAAEPLGDLVARFVTACEQALTMGQELATEHRLLREENEKLRQVVAQLDEVFAGVKKDKLPTARDKILREFLWRSP